MTIQTQKILTRIMPIVLGGALLVPSFALALVPVVAEPTSASVDATVQTTGATATVKVGAKMQSAISKADKEIDRRTAALTDLNTRIQATQKVTPAFKQTLSTNVQNQLTGLAALKVKIDADTDLTALKNDIQTISQSYRIYMLVIPQARIATAADREIIVITMMNQLGTKLQVRLSAAQSAGSDVATLLAALQDMSQKLTDARTQAEASVSVSSALAPDGGDTTKMAANTAALKTARGDIVASEKDLVAARKDVDTILKGLKSLSPASVSATTTTTTTP